jgi:hypothetical protein
MSMALSTLVVLAGLAVLSVLLLRVMSAYRKYRGTWLVECPETDTCVEIALDTKRAAVSSAVGAPQLQVRQCSRWPDRHDCDQSCLN